jgi:hypothetical protein
VAVAPFATIICGIAGRAVAVPRGWLLKISTPKLMPDGTPGLSPIHFQNWAGGAAIGPVPGWVVVVAVAAFYGGSSTWRCAAMQVKANSPSARCTFKVNSIARETDD